MVFNPAILQKWTRRARGVSGMVWTKYRYVHPATGIVYLVRSNASNDYVQSYSFPTVHALEKAGFIPQDLVYPEGV